MRTDFFLVLFFNFGFSGHFMLENSLPKGTKKNKTVSLILLVFRLFPPQLLMRFKNHSYEQIKLPVPLEIQ